MEATYAALYRRPANGPAWAGRRLRPAAPQWMAEPDPFGAAASALRDAGLSVTAWIVLTHSTRLGTAFPDVAVVNCFGERYPYALCPSHEEVRDYAACANTWTSHGLEPDEVTAQLRSAVRSSAGDGAVDDKVADILLAVRHPAADALRAQTLSLVRNHVPEAPITLHAHPGPRPRHRGPPASARPRSNASSARWRCRASRPT